MSYSRVNWKKYPDTSTPVSAENLNTMDAGISDVDSRLTTVEGNINKTSTAKTGTAQSDITSTIASGTSLDDVVGTLLNNDITQKSSLTNKADASSLTYKSTTDYATAYSNANDVIMVVATATVNNTPCAFSIIVPKLAIESSGRYWEMGDSYNGGTDIHMQIFLNKATASSMGLYYGSTKLSATFTYYYR